MDLKCWKYLEFLQIGNFCTFYRKLDSSYFGHFHMHKAKACTFTLRNVRRVWKYQREVIRICKSKERQHNGQRKKDKKRSTKHYTEN